MPWKVLYKIQFYYNVFFFLLLYCELIMDVCFHSSLSEKTLLAIHKQFREYGFVPRSVKKPRAKRCLQPEDITRVITFIRSYAEKYAVVLPGRQANQRNFSGEVLPSAVTRAAVWRDYKEKSKEYDPGRLKRKVCVCVWNSFYERRKSIISCPLYFRLPCCVTQFIPIHLEVVFARHTEYQAHVRPMLAVSKEQLYGM